MRDLKPGDRRLPLGSRGGGLSRVGTDGLCGGSEQGVACLLRIGVGRASALRETEGGQSATLCIPPNWHGGQRSCAPGGKRGRFLDAR